MALNGIKIRDTKTDDESTNENKRNTQNELEIIVDKLGVLNGFAKCLYNSSKIFRRFSFLRDEKHQKFTLFYLWVPDTMDRKILQDLLLAVEVREAYKSVS